MDAHVRKVICALDTADLDEALAITRRLQHRVGAFKVGHALTLPHGLEVVDRLQDAGAHRIFLDLKFHDIPNSVALAVAEAAKRKVWMMTVHIVGGPAMITAAMEEARACSEADAPLLVGVSVLTSLDQHTLETFIGVQQPLEDHMVRLSKLGCDYGLDGVVCSAQEVKVIRQAIGPTGVIVTPGIRLPSGESHDQKRTGNAVQAIEDGASYLVIGRALTHTPEPDYVLEQMGLLSAGIA